MRAYGFQSFGCLFELVKLIVLGIHLILHRLFPSQIKPPKT